MKILECAPNFRFNSLSLWEIDLMVPSPLRGEGQGEGD